MKFHFVSCTDPLKIMSDDMSIDYKSLQFLKTALKNNNDPSVFIAFCGSSRSGKSTLINVILSCLANADLRVFSVEGGMNNVTHGVNLCVAQCAIDNTYMNIFFLDLRGTNNENATQDIYLPFVAYILADILIVNEQRFIQNSTLEVLKGAATYVNKIREYTEKEVKNKQLIFRIADFKDDMSKITDEFKKQTLHHVLFEKHKDHIQNIRDAIRVLFLDNNIDLFFTDEVNKKNTPKFNNGEYLWAIKEDPFLRILVANLLQNAANHAKTKPKMGAGAVVESVIKKLEFIKDTISKEDFGKPFDVYQNYNELIIMKHIASEGNKQRITELIRRSKVLCDFPTMLGIIKDANAFLAEYQQEFQMITWNLKFPHIRDNFLAEFSENINKQVKPNLEKFKKYLNAQVDPNTTNISAELTKIIKDYKIDVYNGQIQNLPECKIIIKDGEYEQLQPFVDASLTPVFNQILRENNDANQMHEAKEKLEHIQFLKKIQTNK